MFIIKIYEGKMKKRITIALIILVTLTAVGLSLYFFVFKDKNMSREQAENLVIRASIDTGAIQNYEDAPTLSNLNTGSGDNNIINSNLLESISQINLINQVWTEDLKNYQTEQAKSLVKIFHNIIKVNKSELNKVYEYKSTNPELIEKVVLTIIGNEVIITAQVINKTTQAVSAQYFYSFFYDSIDNEYEFVKVYKDNSGYRFERTKANSNGLISQEIYILTGTTDENILLGIKNGEGASSIDVYNFINRTYKKETLNKITSVDNHFRLSSYIYQIYENFNEKLESNIKLIKEEKTPLVIDKVFGE